MCFLHGAWKGERCAHRKKCFNARGGSPLGEDPLGLCNKSNGFGLVVEELHVTLPCIPTCMKTEMQLAAWHCLLSIQAPLQVLYPSQGTTLSRSPLPSCKQGDQSGTPPRSAVQRTEDPQKGSKVVPCAQRAAYPLHRVACGEHCCCRRTKCASPLPRLNCAQMQARCIT